MEAFLMHKYNSVSVDICKSNLYALDDTGKHDPFWYLYLLWNGFAMHNIV